MQGPRATGRAQGACSCLASSRSCHQAPGQLAAALPAAPPSAAAMLGQSFAHPYLTPLLHAHRASLARFIEWAPFRIDGENRGHPVALTY